MGERTRSARTRGLAAWVVGVLCVAGSDSVRAVSGPRIEVESQRVSVGALNRGQTAEASFALRNTGEDVLRILEARPG